MRKEIEETLASFLKFKMTKAPKNQITQAKKTLALVSSGQDFKDDYLKLVACISTSDECGDYDKRIIELGEMVKCS